MAWISCKVNSTSTTAPTVSNQKGQHNAGVEPTTNGYRITFPSIGNLNYVPQYCLAIDLGFINHGSYDVDQILMYAYNTAGSYMRAPFYITIWAT